MKLVLVQLDAGGRWHGDDLADWLSGAPHADLVVFPECYPFWRTQGIAHATAVARLEAVAQSQPGRSFIAGGYVYEDGPLGKAWRNRSYLVHAGRVTDHYDKQWAFQGEQFTPGRRVKLFSWGAHRCLPLICADADTGPGSPFMQRLVRRALALGVGPDVPIIVSSYGAMLDQPYWTDSLHHLADRCGAPLLICGIAGVSSSRFDLAPEDDAAGLGGRRPYGGGGSGLFIPGVRPPRQRKDAGYVSVNLGTWHTRWTAFA